MPIEINRERYYSNIREKLTFLVTAVKLDNTVNLQSLNIHMENVFAGVLNILFDWQLINANAIEQNAAAFDLFDSEKKILVQVSSKHTHKKIQEESLDKIEWQANADGAITSRFEGYHYYFLALTEKVQKYKPFTVPSFIIFNGQDDIYDVSRILSGIMNASLEKQKALSDMLDNELSSKRAKEAMAANAKEASHNPNGYSLVGDGLKQWIKNRLHEIKSGDYLYQNLCLNLFVDEFLSQETETVAIARIEKDYYNSVLLRAEAFRLSTGNSVVFFKSTEEAKSILAARSDAPEIFRKLGKTVIFIERLQSAKDVRYIEELAVQLRNCKIIASAYEWILQGSPVNAFCTTICVPDIKEVEYLVSSVCTSEGYPCSSLLIDCFMQPLYEQLRTPVFTTLIIRRMRDTGISLAESKNGILLFDLLDDYYDATGDSLRNAILSAVQVCFSKKMNVFHEKDLDCEASVIAKLEAFGVWGKFRNHYLFLCEDYLHFKIAETALEAYGDNGVEYLIAAKCEKSIPFIFSMLDHRYRIKPNVALLKSASKETINRTIDLFLSNPLLAEILGIPNAFDAFEDLMYRYMEHGYYDTAQMALRNLCQQNPDLLNDRRIAQLKMVSDYYCTGVFSDCNNKESVTYWLYKGILMYISDHYYEAAEACETALSMTTDEDTISKVIVNYIDVLLDSGKQKKVGPLLARYDQFYGGIQNLETYYISKGDAATAQLDFEDAYSYFSEAHSKMQTYYNASAMARIYGDIGLVDYYRGYLQEAEANYYKNENICIDSENANGIAISRQYIALKELFSGNYEKAYNYLSGALFYAEKAQNKWRYVQIQYMIDHFSPSFCDRVENHIAQIETAIPSPQFHSDCYVWFLECMLRSGCEKKQVDAVLKYADIANENTDCLLNQSIIQIYKDLLAGEKTVPPVELMNYSFLAEKVVSDYRNGFLIPSITTPLPFWKYTEIETGRLFLRHISKRHATGIFRYASRPQSTKYVLWKRHKSIVDTFEYIKHVYHMETSGTYLLWVIIEKNSNQVIGTIDLDYNDTHEAVEFGIILSDYYWGRGYGSEALNRICEFCKSVLLADKIIGVCVKGNRNSERLMKKNGFSFVAELLNYHSIASLPDKSGLLFQKQLSE